MEIYNLLRDRMNDELIRVKDSSFTLFFLSGVLSRKRMHFLQEQLSCLIIFSDVASSSRKWSLPNTKLMSARISYTTVQAKKTKKPSGTPAASLYLTSFTPTARTVRIEGVFEQLQGAVPDVVLNFNSSKLKKTSRNNFECGKLAPLATSRKGEKL